MTPSRMSTGALLVLLATQGARKNLKPSDKHHLFKLCQRVCNTQDVFGLRFTLLALPAARAVATPVDRMSVPLERHVADPVFEALWPI